MKIIDHTAVGGRPRWDGVVAALRAGHLLPKAEISDQLLTRGADTLLSRAAWIDGLGFGVKSVSVMAGNTAKGLTTVQGAMLVFEDQGGRLRAIVDSGLVTYWKTAGDSVFGASLLARPDARCYVILGAGVVAESLVRAYAALFPGLTDIAIWNRTASTAQKLARKLQAEGYPVTTITDLPEACARADIISTATMSKDPVLRGDWIKPGTHIDLIGAFKADMREADDTLMKRGRVFVDSLETTVEHIGELILPLASGAINRHDILGDYHDLLQGCVGRITPEDITVLKNGGGAHLDLMTATYLLSVAQ